MDIAGWLSSLGLGKYATTFAKNEITPEVLPHLSDADLKELGLPMGPRKLVLAAIAELGKSDMRDPKPVGRFERLSTVRGRASPVDGDVRRSGRIDRVVKSAGPRRDGGGDPQVPERGGRGDHASGWPCGEVHG